MIKFRVIHIVHDIVSIIYDTDGYVIDQKGNLYENYGESFVKPVWEVPFDSECKVSLFTGLKDKNDKEIYDGDILKISDDYSNELLAIVEFNNINYPEIHGWNLVKCTSKKFDYPKHRAIDYYYGVGPEPYHEVIGNIYENPDLISEK